MGHQNSDQHQSRDNQLDNRALSRNEVAEDLKSMVKAIWQRKSWIFVTTLFCLIAGLVFILMTEPLYRGTSQLFIDPRSKSLIDNEIVPTGLGRSSIGGDLVLLDSQIEIIRSDTILRAVLKKEKEQGLTPPPTSPSLMKQVLDNVRNLLNNSDAAPIDPDYEQLREFRKALWVSRLRNSYVVGINVRSTDPDRAARLANLVAETYISEQSESRSSTTRQTTVSLNARVEELRNGVRAAEAAVEAYRAETGLIGTEGRLIDDDQLRDLNNRVVAAKAETSIARARYQALRDASVSDVLAGSSNEALSSSVVSNLRLQLANITRRESDALARFGPRHPSLAALQSERAGVNRLLSEELARIVKSAENNLEVAKANERFVQTQFDELTQESIQNQQALVRMRELEREAASSRSVLESFLVKAKQSNEQEELSNDSTRVISPAAVPTIAFFPQKKLIMAAALFVGLGLGTTLAWLRALFSTPVLQTREETIPPLPQHSQSAKDTGGSMMDSAPNDGPHDWSERIRQSARMDMPIKSSYTNQGEMPEFQPRQDRSKKPRFKDIVASKKQQLAKQESDATLPAKGLPISHSIDREPTVEEGMSRLADAINALLPKSAETMIKNNQAASDISPQPEISEASSSIRPSYPEHLIVPVEQSTEIIGQGGHIYGDAPTNDLYDQMVETNISRSQDKPTTPFANASDRSYPRPRSSDLLRKLRGKH